MITQSQGLLSPYLLLRNHWGTPKCEVLFSIENGQKAITRVARSNPEDVKNSLSKSCTWV